MNFECIQEEMYKHTKSLFIHDTFTLFKVSLNEASHNLLIKPGKGIIATENESAKLCFIFHNVLYFPLKNIVLEAVFCTCYNRPVEVVLMLMHYG